MGSTSSKFKKCIQNGDEYAAMQLYQSSPDLKRTFDPNSSYGESRNHNTAMHFAARHGMKHLLRTFLNELGGDPNKKNSFDETVLHSACSIGPLFPPPPNHLAISCVQLTGVGSRSTVACNPLVEHPENVAPPTPLTASGQERRAACVSLLLQWRGASLTTISHRDRIDVNAFDRENNSALHLAASAGMMTSCRLLLSAGAHTLVKDNRGKTPAQCAVAGGHTRLAALLEKAAILSQEEVDLCSLRWGWTAEEAAEAEEDELDPLVGGDTHEGLRSQELREAKDRLLVDTCDMLRVSLFTAEALLRENEWCKEVLVEKWTKDPTACCQAAGVSLPGGSLDSEHPDDNLNGDEANTIIECGICCEEVTMLEAGGGACGHIFCMICWKKYLEGRVREGDARPTCPAPRCRRVAPPALLQRSLSPETQRKYLLFDIKAFVESSRNMKWCPVANCGRAVRLLAAELMIPAFPINANGEGEELCPGGYPMISRGVNCGDFHLFCWECNGDAHPPIGCAAWNRWLSRTGAAPSAPLSAAIGGAESAASSLWLLAHCKPCPSCSCPIQKNDGCNHMKCTKCKFDFCWVCLESWKRHGSATGGYFRCTREDATARANLTRGAALAEARVQNIEAQEQWRFAMACARYRRHEQRWSTEKPMLLLTPAKAKALDTTGILLQTARELSLCRKVLIGSCAYTFVLPVNSPHRAAFYYAMEELERWTSRLASLIIKPAVEAPLSVLKKTTVGARGWRLTVLRVARPPPPPPQLSASELRMMARLLAKGRLDPRDPWKKSLGPRGEPLRVPEPFDPDHTILQDPQITVPPSTTTESSATSTDTDVYHINVSEYNMDLIIALEMSRLQMLEDQARRAADSETSTSQDSSSSRSRQRPTRLNISVSIGTPSDYEDKLSLSDDQLKLAIQLSLEEPPDRLQAIENHNDDKSSSGPCGSSSNLGGTSFSVSKDGVNVGEASDSRMTRQEENWSRAADITVGYFLKALGGAPLDIPNLALGLDLLARQEKSGKDKSDDASTSHLPDHMGLKSRPPLLRSGVGGQRPPLLRQIGGKVRRSWSMGDISIKSSSTDDPTYGKMPDEGLDNDPHSQDNLDMLPDDRIVQNKRSFQSQTYDMDRNTQLTITKNIQIDSASQQCDVNYDIIKTKKCSQNEHHKPPPLETSAAKAIKDDHTRKKIAFSPKNLPWGEFCCEKKCVKTGNGGDGQSPSKYLEKLVKPNMVLPDAEPPTTITVDCRGKVNPEVFDFSEKTIHLPDLNSSHLRVNTYLTKLAINRNSGLLGERLGNNLNQNDIISDNFRRHSDHIPRVERDADKVKASSSEKHLGEKNRISCSVEASPEKPKIKTVNFKETKTYNSESPKKSSKVEKCSKSVPVLSIRICDASQDKNTSDDGKTSNKIRRGLETDSSNECESETGIPKSPTLYISGVSICRETSPKSSSPVMTHPESNSSRPSTSSQYFSPIIKSESNKHCNIDQKSPKPKQKLSWKSFKENKTILSTSPVIVHVTSPSISPCSERNIEIRTDSPYSSTSQELFKSSKRSATPSDQKDSCNFNNGRFSSESLNILDVPVMPPSHFSDDVFIDEEIIDCSKVNESPKKSNHRSLRGTVYATCHSEGIVISNISPIGSSSKTESSPTKKVCSDCKFSKKDEALYENIFPQSEQMNFDMSLPSSPKNVMATSSNLQKSWSARPLINAQDYSEDSQAPVKSKSKSANEPERDREMFNFPKSSTDGALSSVLHVQESNLSSDDFHEALFLLERSPKTRDSKKRKRSKKREKDKNFDANKKEREQERKNENKKAEDSHMCACNEANDGKNDKDDNLSPNRCTIENDSPSIEQDEASSAL